MNVRQAIDSSPMGALQWSIVLIATFINALDGYDVLAMAFTANSVQNEFGLNGSQLGLLLSSGLVGMAIGALVFGPIADHLGRRKVLLIALATNMAGLFLSATATSALTMGLWRIVTGLGVGGILACITVIVSEFSNDKHRGMSISIYTAGYGVGATLGGMGAAQLIPSLGWRSVFLAGGILTVAAIVLTAALVPESPDFYRQRQPQNVAEKLQKIVKRIGKQQIVTDYALPPMESVPKTQVKDLLTHQLRMTSFKIWAAFFVIMFGFYFANSWTPKLLMEVGLSENQGILGGMALTFGGALGSLLYGALSTKFNKRRLLMVFTVLSGIMLVGFIYSTSMPMVAILAAVLVGILMNGCIAGLYTITPESYPTRLRATGVGTGLGIGRAGSILAPTIVGALLDAGWSPQSLYTMVAVVVVSATLFLMGLRTYMAQSREENRGESQLPEAGLAQPQG